MVKAIFFDIDGTLVSFKNHQISQSTFDALYKLKEKGIKLFIATGRGKDGLDVLNDFPFDGYITLNGQYCYTNDQIIYSNTIKKEDLQALLDYLEDHQVPCGFTEENTKYFNYRDKRVDAIHAITHNDDHPAGDCSHVIDKSIYQIMCFVDEKEEKEMIHNVFEFGETEIKEIMTPRIHVESLPDDCTYDELMKVYHEAQYSRYPIHDESFDEIIGVLNMKDLLFIDIDKEHFDVKKYMRGTFVVYEFNQVNDVFASMRKNHATLAIVLDEYGVMSGIVTFEDIVEEIVGEIDDEYDEVNDSIVKINDHEYLVDGSLNLNEVNDEIDTHFESEDFESIGGLVLGEFSGVPKIKDQIEFPGVTIIIEKMHKNRIELLRLKIHEIEKEEEGEEKHQ